MITLPNWRRQIGLEDYATVFAENGVHFEALRLLTEADRAQLGLLLGHRRKLLKALAHLDDSAVLAAHTAQHKHLFPHFPAPWYTAVMI